MENVFWQKRIDSLLTQGFVLRDRVEVTRGQRIHNDLPGFFIEGAVSAGMGTGVEVGAILNTRAGVPGLSKSAVAVARQPVFGVPSTSGATVPTTIHSAQRLVGPPATRRRVLSKQRAIDGMSHGRVLT
jgi:hypothetical protein